MKPSVFLATSALALSALSLWVVFDGAAAEPYISFRSWDALEQIGLAMILMLLWLQLACWMILGVVRRRLSAWWLFLLVLIFICERYLVESPSGYIQDITRYVAICH